MTAQNRSVNKSRFETGDRPTGSDFADLIDSFLSLTDTSAQSIASPITFAQGATFGAPVTAPSVVASGATIGAVTAGTVTVSGAVTAGSMALLGGFVQPVTALTVTGTTQGSAAALIAGVNAVATATNGTNDSCRLPVPSPGQSNVVVINAAATAIRVYPATGAAIGGAGANASISVTASTNAVFFATSELQWYVIRGN